MSAPQSPVRREIAALATDIVGFSPFADITEPEYVFQTLAEYYELIAQIVEPMKTSIHDITGDSVLIIFDRPGDPARAIESSIRAALDIQRHGAELVSRWQKRGQKLGLKQSLHAGHATMGRVGAGAYSKDAAVGSVVNAVFHLGREARAGEILASERVADHAHDLAQVSPRPGIELPGLSRRFRVFLLRAL